jgi:hypothetical protein
MSQQYNKILKRRRRICYLRRLKRRRAQLRSQSKGTPISRP